MSLPRWEERIAPSLEEVGIAVAGQDDAATPDAPDMLSSTVSTTSVASALRTRLALCLLVAAALTLASATSLKVNSKLEDQSSVTPAPLANPVISDPEDLKPNAPTKERNFLFGYGSLINAKSRSLTSRTGSSFPATVRGLRRSWNYHQPSRKMTAVGASFESGFETNGVIVRVASTDLPLFDKREKGYHREPVPLNQIVLNPQAGDLKLQDTDRVWVYVVDSPVSPSQDLPISQSYVDVVLDGCLRISEEFARQFIQDTGLWKLADGSVNWLDDRVSPRIYSTEFVSNSNKATIDRLLKEAIPDALNRRRKPNDEGTNVITTVVPVQTEKP